MYRAFESKHVALASVFQCSYLFFSRFGRRKVHFGLVTKSIEVNSLYFTIFIIYRVDISTFFSFFESENCLRPSVCR